MTHANLVALLSRAIARVPAEAGKLPLVQANEEKCFECGDGEPYCVTLKAENTEGGTIENASLQVRNWDESCL